MDSLLPFRVDTILRPKRSVIELASKVSDTRKWWSVMLRSKTQAWNQPTAINLSSICAFDPPLMLLVIPQRCLDVLVVLDMVIDPPFLIDVLEVAAQFRPRRIAFFKGVIHVQSTHRCRKLIGRNITSFKAYSGSNNWYIGFSLSTRAVHC